jgi:hypothetical protein
MTQDLGEYLLEAARKEDAEPGKVALIEAAGAAADLLVELFMDHGDTRLRGVALEAVLVEPKLTLSVLAILCTCLARTEESLERSERLVRSMDPDLAARVEDHVGSVE